MNTGKLRLSYIDSLKGIAILFVLLGHNSPNIVVTYMIYFFHMPLFFFISGYLSKGTNGIKTIYAKKVKTLIYPYFIYGGIIIIYNSLFDFVRHSFTFNKLIKRISALLYGNFIWENNSDYIGTLWFLVCLFCTVMIGEFIIKINHRNRWGQPVLCGISILLGTGCVVLKKNLNLRLPWCLDVAFFAVIFYLGGYLMRRMNYKIRVYGSMILMIAGTVLGWLNCIYMKKWEYSLLRTDMLNMNYGNIALFLLSALSICIGALELFKQLSGKLKIVWLEKVGQISMIVMIVHIYVNQIVIPLLNKVNLNTWTVSFPVCTCISIGAAVILHKKCYFFENFDEMKRRLN